MNLAPPNSSGSPQLGVPIVADHKIPCCCRVFITWLHLIAVQSFALSDMFQHIATFYNCCRLLKTQIHHHHGYNLSRPRHTKWSLVAQKHELSAFKAWLPTVFMVYHLYHLQNGHVGTYRCSFLRNVFWAGWPSAREKGSATQFKAASWSPEATVGWLVGYGELHLVNYIILVGVIVLNKSAKE